MLKEKSDIIHENNLVCCRHQIQNECTPLIFKYYLFCQKGFGECGTLFSFVFDTASQLLESIFHFPAGSVDSSYHTPQHCMEGGKNACIVNQIWTGPVQYQNNLYLWEVYLRDPIWTLLHLLFLLEYGFADTYYRGQCFCDQSPNCVEQERWQ